MSKQGPKGFRLELELGERLKALLTQALTLVVVLLAQ